MALPMLSSLTPMIGLSSPFRLTSLHQQGILTLLKNGWITCHFLQNYPQPPTCNQQATTTRFNGPTHGLSYTANPDDRILGCGRNLLKKNRSSTHIMGWYSAWPGELRLGLSHPVGSFEKKRAIATVHPAHRRLRRLPRCLVWHIRHKRRCGRPVAQ